MSESHTAAVSSGDAALLDTWDLTVGVQSWGVAYYNARYGRLLDAHRFDGIFLDGWSKSITDYRGLRQAINLGAWDGRWSIMGQTCVGTVSPVGPF